MNFELNETQRQLLASVQRLLADHYGFEQRRAIAASAAGHSPAVWAHLAELGVTGLLVSEDDGGFGGRMEDLLPVLQACGGALLLEPLLASAVFGATALGVAADAATRARLLPEVAAGRCVLAWAHDEPGAQHAPVWTETRATPRGDGWTLSGRKLNVLHGALAHQLVVSARVSGASDAAGGRALFLVDAQAQGVQRREHRLIDDTPAAEISLDQASALPLGNAQDAAHANAAIAATLAAGTAALCADMLGAAERAYELAVEYMNVRQQFGRVIGSNQALRHRAAEMLVSLEMCRSMALAAAVAVDQPHAEDARLDLMRAKLILGRHARQVCQHAIQCHGGIGMTEEYAVGHCLRRVHVADQLLGDADAQAARLAAVQSLATHCS